MRKKGAATVAGIRPEHHHGLGEDDAHLARLRERVHLSLRGRLHHLAAAEPAARARRGGTSSAHDRDEQGRRTLHVGITSDKGRGEV